MGGTCAPHKPIPCPPAPPLKLHNQLVQPRQKVRLLRVVEQRGQQAGGSGKLPLCLLHVPVLQAVLGDLPHEVAGCEL